MHELRDLRDKLCEELEKYAKKDITVTNLEYIDKLAHATKNIDKILEASDYSSMTPRASRGILEPHRGMYDDGVSMTVRRDARGRYASDGDMLSELHEIRKNAPDEHTRMELDRFIQKMETMR